MAGQKKFGTFAGVFTPSILTILGVIMYMRMGWVVGNAGLIGTIIIIVIAHVISVSTGLSLSSTATDKKVGAGGIYYILSRSMGIPIGGAIGITLYVGTAFSIALYLIGFAESFNQYLGYDTSINGLRISGTIALVALSTIALISTAVALKTQFFILVAIIVSLVSIFLGTHDYAPEVVNMFATKKSVPLETVFAIFFPAVTGFTAGVAMSGDLKDPKKSLPVGTIASIAVGFLVYIGLAFFISYYVDAETLRTDNNILLKIAKWGPAVVAGIWGATLSSALGGILGGPRILQAMSVDKVTPRIFGKGKGKDNEPVNALILVFIIAQAGILIGELDVIASVVSMFYLAAYGFINLSFFLESWANPDFQPTFKVSKWFGLLGFIASFAIMFKLNMIAMFGAIIIIIAIYLWLQRKQVKLESGDVWQSVWENVVAKGLRKLDTKEVDTSANWNPNIILFSGESSHQHYLLELSNTLAGRTGIVTNFKLILDKKGKPFTKSEQIIKESSFDDLGIFARQVKVENIYLGIENIASTFGFSGVEPNTIMMGWPKKLNDSSEYSSMTERLIDLDYNLLYLDFDTKAKFGKYQSVDLWWRETDSNNAEMMLNIVRFITQSDKWNKAKIRVLFVNHNNIDSNLIKSKIARLVDELRVNIEIVVINNGVEQRPFYDIIALQSATTDLILLGIPNIKTEKQAAFVLNTSNLFESIGSTILVKASNNFNKLELDLAEVAGVSTEVKTTLDALPVSENTKVNSMVGAFDSFLASSTEQFIPAMGTVASFYSKYIDSIATEYDKTIRNIESKQAISSSIGAAKQFVRFTIDKSEKFKDEQLHSLEESLDKALNTYLNDRKEFQNKQDKTIDLGLATSKKVKWKNLVNYYFSEKIHPNTLDVLHQFGVNNFMLPIALSKGINKQSQLFIENLGATNINAIEEYKENTAKVFKDLKNKVKDFETQTLASLRSLEREVCIDIIKGIENPTYVNRIKKLSAQIDKKVVFKNHHDTSSFAKDWHNNQLLSHMQAESDLYLTNSGLSLTTINEKIKKHIDIHFIKPQKRKLEILIESEKTIRKNLSENDLKQYVNKDVDEIAEGFTHANFRKLIAAEEANVLALSNAIPKTVELMSPLSFNELLKEQTDEIETVKINLSTLQNHIIQSVYLEGLQDSLLRFEKTYNQNSENIYNAAHRISHLIDEVDDESGFEAILKDVQKGIAQNAIILTNLNDAVHLDLKTMLHNTIDTLEVRTILDSEELLTRATNRPIQKNKFKEKFRTKKEQFSTSIQKIKNLANTRKKDIDALRFEKKHNQYINIIEQTNDFVSSFEIDRSVRKILPYYYKKLFTGSHAANTNTIRSNEFSKAKKALNRIENGVNGAIMIIGKSQSGKSFFTDALVKLAENTDRFIINPPSNQSFTIKDLHLGFQHALSKKGTSTAILQKLKKRSVFVFNDLERWWLKSEKGNTTINYLSNLINQFGDKHIFILNTNIYSYAALRKTTTIEKSLLSTIIIPPVDPISLQEIIINRHKIGGAEVFVEDELVVDSKSIKAIINAIHTASHGNIGVALQTWVNAIRIGEDDKLFIEKPKKHEFPNINNAQWKLVLYHFIIHKTLHKKHLKKIFGKHADQVIQTIQEMEKSGLVLSENEVYSIHENLVFLIEKQLLKFNILNQ